MRKMFGVLLAAMVATPSEAEIIRCTWDTSDRSNCEKIRGLCEVAFDLDIEQRLVRQLPEMRGEKPSLFQTRIWDDNHIEAASWASAKEGADGRKIYESVYVVTFDRTTGNLLAFYEYFDADGKKFDQAGIDRLIAAGHGGFFGVRRDQGRMTGQCVAAKRAF